MCVYCDNHCAMLSWVVGTNAFLSSSSKIQRKFEMAATVGVMKPRIDDIIKFSFRYGYSHAKIGFSSM